MKRHTPPIPARRAAIAILIVGFFFASAFYRCGTPSPPPAPPSPAPAPITTPVPAPEPAYDPDQGRDPTMESAETTTSYAGQDQQGAAVNCGMVHGGTLVNGVCYHGSSNTGSGSANQIGDADVYGAIADGAEKVGETLVDAYHAADDAVDGVVCSTPGQVGAGAVVGAGVAVATGGASTAVQAGTAAVTGGGTTAALVMGC